MSNVSDWPPRADMGKMSQLGHCGEKISRIGQMLAEAEARAIDRIISQPHWRPALTVLAMAIRRVNRTYQPKTRRNDQ